MKKETLRFKVHSIRNLESPFSKKGCKNFYCVVDVKQLPDLENWRKINVRDPKLTGSVPAKIIDSFHSNPEMFLFMSRGLLLSAEKVVYDQLTSEIAITLTDENIHGLGDGGHTYTIIRNEAKDLPATRTQYVKIEILEGFSLDDIALVVEGRNTSNQVKDQSIMELKHQFDDLKTFLKPQVVDRIAFSEYETDASGTPRPVSIRDVIAVLTMFNKDHFTDGTQPVIAYSSKHACLQRFKESTKTYKKLYPLAQEILELHDHVYNAFGNLYNTAGKLSGTKTRGNFANVTGAAAHKNGGGPTLHFIGSTSAYTVPTGFVYPMVAAFRAFLEEKKGVYYWGKGIDPVKLLESDLAIQLAGTIGEEALKNQNPTKTGKSALLWQTCYQKAELFYLKMK